MSNIGGGGAILPGLIFTVPQLSTADPLSGGVIAARRGRRSTLRTGKYLPIPDEIFRIFVRFLQNEEREREVRSSFFYPSGGLIISSFVVPLTSLLGREKRTWVWAEKTFCYFWNDIVVLLVT